MTQRELLGYAALTQPTRLEGQRLSTSPEVGGVTASPLLTGEGEGEEAT